MTLRFDDSAVRDLLKSAEMKQTLLEAGGQVAAEAAALGRAQGLIESPSKGGLASIHAELASSGGLPEARVSWDTAHYYLQYAELGSQHQPATPFLRPAALRFS